MIRKIGLLLLFCLLFCRCQKTFLGSDPPSSPVNNFESLWKKIDERYSFFNYKNIDWNLVHEKYRPRINDSTTDIQLFSVLFEMLAELRDAHVNLVSPFNVSRYEDVFTKSQGKNKNRTGTSLKRSLVADYRERRFRLVQKLRICHTADLNLL